MEPYPTRCRQTGPGPAASTRVDGRRERDRAGGMARAGGAALLLALAWGTASADVPIEAPGSVETLPLPLQPHWVWVADGMLERTSLVDLDAGRFLGQIDAGWGLAVAEFPRTRSEIYVPETYYSRGTRGERTDVVTIYDAGSLAPVDEVILPPKRATNPLPSANAALSDDDRFLAVFNMNPATSLSIVDMERRAFAGEIETPGCSLVYAAGPRRFAMLCANGALLTVRIDDAGREVSKRRSRPFFDPESDPVTEKAVRHGDRWVFVSFEGYAHVVDLSGDEPRFEDPWSLIGDGEREQRWRIGGRQHLALHEATGRLFSLMHQGDVDTHKDPGTELWVYDLDRRERVQRIELRNPGLTIMGFPIEFGREWVWPFSGTLDFLLDRVLPSLGIAQVLVTQDDAPLLVTSSMFTGGLAVYDALSGEFLRRVFSGNFTTQVLQSPWRPPHAGAPGRKEGGAR